MLNNPDVLEAIHSKNEGSLKVSKHFPSQVQTNSIFLVDVLGHTLADVTADGTGCYKNDGTFRWHYEQTEEKTYRCIRHKYRRALPRDQLDKNTLVVVKTYYQHKQHPDFKRIVTYVEDHRNPIVNNLVIVAYMFDGKEHPVVPKPHGNSKGAAGYTKVKPTIVKELSHVSQRCSVPQALESHIKSKGGRTKISPECKPTPYQVYREKVCRETHSQSTDDFQYIMDWAQQHPTVCRYVASHPEPIIVLATEQQLTDLKRFTTGWSTDLVT